MTSPDPDLVDRLACATIDDTLKMLSLLPSLHTANALRAEIARNGQPDCDPLELMMAVGERVKDAEFTYRLKPRPAPTELTVEQASAGLKAWAESGIQVTEREETGE